MGTYILKFTNELEAKSILTNWIVNYEGSDVWYVQPECNLNELLVIEELGEYDNSDIENPITVSDRIVSSDYWVSIYIPNKLKTLSDDIKALDNFVVSDSIHNKTNYNISDINNLLNSSRSLFLNQVKDYSDNLFMELTKEYTYGEKLFLQARYEAAFAIKENVANQIQMDLLQEEADILEIAIEDRAIDVYDEIYVYNRVSSAITGFRVKITAYLNEATTENTMLSIMSQMTVQAQTRLQELSQS